MPDARHPGALMASTDVCAKKREPANLPCNEPVFYLDAALAQQLEYGVYSGWYHRSKIINTNHYAVPKKWLS